MTVCPSCGAENPEGFRFCGSCGAALAEAPSAREVRKTVTILFCDMTGSTTLGERLDSESLRRVMERYFTLAREVLERHGGTVEKFIGDAVMAVFGIPVVHEDDALRAARAAHELREELAGLNADLLGEFGTELQVRIGVNTGEVVTSQGGTLATGDAVNVAARLEQAADSLRRARSSSNASTPSRPRASRSRSSLTACLACGRTPRPSSDDSTLRSSVVPRAGAASPGVYTRRTRPLVPALHGSRTGRDRQVAARPRVRRVAA